MVEVYAGLDVSDKMTHVCVVDGCGDVIWSGACATDPEVIARTLKTRAAGLVRAQVEGTRYLSPQDSQSQNLTPRLGRDRYRIFPVPAQLEVHKVGSPPILLTLRRGERAPMSGMAR
jgi:hypothetical protein